MNTIREHFNRVRKVEEALPPGESLWLVSVGDAMRGRVGGRITQVTRQIAARLIEDGSHRLASDEEAAAEESRQETAREQARNARMHPRLSYRGECVVLGPKNERKTGR